MYKKSIYFILVFAAFFSTALNIYGQDDLNIWREFVETLKNGKFTINQIRPYEHIHRDGLLKTIQNFKGYADGASSWDEWETTPEIFSVDDHVHFLVPLGFGGENKSTFCFTFLKQGDEWFYRHLENIFIRLDQTPEAPTSEFPDLPEQTKAWQRQEVYWSKMVYFYNVLTKEKDKEFFLNLMKDGAGYFLTAKVWVPFITPQRAFILYLCWEQRYLQGNHVILEKLTDNEAVVKLQAQFFGLYKRASHLKQQIPFEDYRQIFETIWQNRAVNAGWDLEITYDDPECLQCTLHFSKKH